MKFKRAIATVLVASTLATFIPAKPTYAFPAAATSPQVVEVSKRGIEFVIGSVVIIGTTIYYMVKIPKLPQQSTPNDVKEKVNHKGEIIQRRFYDKNGKPRVDVDLTDHGFPQEHDVPHKHIWSNGKRYSGEPLTQQEYDIYVKPFLKD